MITTIDLLRHGECEGGDCYRGSIDVALTPQGWQRMEQRINRMTNPGWEMVITSPLLRCISFANNIAQDYQLAIQAEAGLQEMHFGDWEGKLIDEIWRTQQTAVEQWFINPIDYPPPNGEAADAFSRRVKACFLDIVREHQGKNILCVTHGGVIRILLAHCLSMSLLDMHRFDVPYACLSRIQVIQSHHNQVQGGSNRYYRLIAHNIANDLDEK